MFKFLKKKLCIYNNCTHLCGSWNNEHTFYTSLILLLRYIWRHYKCHNILLKSKPCFKLHSYTRICYHLGNFSLYLLEDHYSLPAHLLCDSVKWKHDHKKSQVCVREHGLWGVCYQNHSWPFPGKDSALPDVILPLWPNSDSERAVLSWGAVFLIPKREGGLQTEHEPPLL